MNKYIVARFESAKLYQNHKKTKDFSFSKFYTEGRESRTSLYNFKEAITSFQVSNVIHVLFGQRPVSTMRKSLYQPIQKYVDMANNSYIKYDISPSICHKYTVQTKKAIYNSWNPISYVNWYRIKKLCENNYQTLISLINKVLEVDCEKHTFNEVVDMIYTQNLLEEEIIKQQLTQRSGDVEDQIVHINKFNDLFDFITTNKLSPIKNYIISNKEDKSINQNYKTALNVVKGIDNTIIISGFIYIPISEDDLEFLNNNSKGFATILDGGLVVIEDIVNGDELSNEGLIKVSDISLEKVYI